MALVPLSPTCCKGSTFKAETLQKAHRLHVRYHNRQFDRGLRKSLAVLLF